MKQIKETEPNTGRLTVINILFLDKLQAKFDVEYLYVCLCL